MKSKNAAKASKKTVNRPQTREETAAKRIPADRADSSRPAIGTDPEVSTEQTTIATASVRDKGPEPKSGPQHPHRRNALELICLWLTVPSAAIGIADLYERRGHITKDAQEVALWAEERAGDPFHERLQSISKLFGFGSYTAIGLHAGNAHPDPGNNPRLVGSHGYPHDYYGVAPYSKLASNLLMVDKPWSGSMRPNSCLVASGSTVSNRFARLYLPHLGEDPHDKVAKEAKEALIINGDELPYAFYSGGVDMMRVYSMMKDGEKKTRWNGIAFRSPSQSERRIWRPRSSEWLEEDFLLVSKLPMYSRTGIVIGSVVLVSGGHGAGTEAFRLLLDTEAFSRSDLDKLSDAVKGNTYFQVVFRVEVRKDDAQRETRPYKVEVIWDENLRPVAFTPSTRFFRRH